MEKSKKRRRRLGILIVLAAIMVWVGGCAIGQPVGLSTLNPVGGETQVDKGNNEQEKLPNAGTDDGSKVVVDKNSPDGAVGNGNLEKPSVDEGKKPVNNQTDGDVDKSPPTDKNNGSETTPPKTDTTETDKTDKPDKPDKPDKVTPSEKKKIVALTFDDGPDARHTPEVLDILKEKGIKATFFLVGTQIAKYPEVVKRINDEGHAIGNHSYDHKDLSKLSKQQVINEMTRTDDLLNDALGFTPTLFRAPYGAVSSTLKSVLKTNGRDLIGWNVDTRDWAGTSISDMRHMIKHDTRPGSTILMHSFGNKHVKNTVEMLPDVIQDLQDMGYSFVTSDQMQ